MNWDWLGRNAAEITSWTLSHLLLAGLPTVVGLVVAIPLGALASRYRWVYPPLVTLAGLLYTIPSIALFVLLPGLLGTGILDPVNVIVALSVYTVALMVRTVADALVSVPPDVRQAAIAMGFRPVRRLLTVELPIAIPVIGAGLRVAAVSNVSLVAVAALIGVQQLGQLFTKGEQLDFYTPIIAGIVLCALIAVVFDALILSAIRVTTPWRRTGVAA
ncbi:MAG TPA: ABC transporter permease [Nakamurella sp.]|jgi:osmoprotectant transport system permease protein|nr:ABC transporter permease [Nakamurella sp.]